MNISPKSLFKNMPSESSLMQAFPQLREKKAQAFTTVVLTLGAAIIFAFFAINPTLGTIADLRKQLDDSKFVDQQLVTKIANLTALQQQYNTIQKDLSIVQTAVPTTPQIPELVGKLQALAQQNNVSLTRIQTFPVEVALSNQNAPYISYVFNVDLQGQYSGIINFINALGAFDRLTIIDGISIAQSTEPGASLRASIKGKTYFKPLPL